MASSIPASMRLQHLQVTLHISFSLLCLQLYSDDVM
jgi:hypothetical protein